MKYNAGILLGMLIFLLQLRSTRKIDHFPPALISLSTTTFMLVSRNLMV